MTTRYYPTVTNIDAFYQALYAIAPRKSRDVITPREVTANLLTALGNPEKHCRSILITGSKGKGSVALTLSALLQQNFSQVGLFTSPHLFDYRERIRINNTEIEEETLLRLANRAFAAANTLVFSHDDECPRFFEITTAIAYLYFAEKAIDIAVMETGIGAATDAVNQRAHELAILTNVEAEHLDVFGDMETLIQEKCGVMRENTPLILGEEDGDTVEKIFEQARLLSVPVTQISQNDITPKAYTFTLPIGQAVFETDSRMKAKNAMMAIVAIQALTLVLDDMLPINTLKNLRIPAREETVSTAPLIIIDGAHTAKSAENLCNYVMRKREVLELSGQVYLLVSFSAEKNISPVMAAFAGVDAVIVTQATQTRSLPTENISAQLPMLSKQITSPIAALADCREQLQLEDTLIITGSVYLAGWASQVFNTQNKKGI